MTTSPSKTIEPFSIDHLLLAGFIYDNGQLSDERRVELNRRAQCGELNKYYVPYPQRTVTQPFRMVEAWVHPMWAEQYTTISTQAVSWE